MELMWSGKEDLFIDKDINKGIEFIYDSKKSLYPETTNNLFFGGDNLNVLTHLKKKYSSKIKMIYADPPYNINVNSNYSDNLSQDEWLNFMYYRLKLARELLTDDGIMFISISELQFSTLKIICNEIFGKSHFMATLIWKKRTGAGRSTTGISVDHEYILCYEKKKARLLGNLRTFKRFSNPDNDPRGVWRKGKINISLSSIHRPTQFYDITDPKTGKVYKGDKNNAWRWIKKTMDEKIKNNEIVFPKKGKPYLKIFKSKAKSLYVPICSILKDIGLNAEGAYTITKLIGNRAFEYSKPVSLMQFLIEQSTDKNDIILDMFAGSCTTAHAVLKSNMEHSSNKRFIMIQKEEENYSNYSYKTIADIGRDRILKAGEEIKNYNPMFHGDIGFKYFKQS